MKRAQVIGLGLGLAFGACAVLTAREAAAAQTTLGEIARYGLAAVLVIMAAGGLSEAFDGGDARAKKRDVHAARVAKLRRRDPATRRRVTHPSPALVARGAKPRKRGRGYESLAGA